MDNPIITNAATESDNTQDDKFAREFTAFNLFRCPECKYTIKTSPDPRIFEHEDIAWFRIVLEKCYGDITSSAISDATTDMMYFVDWYNCYEEMAFPEFKVVIKAMYRWLEDTSIRIVVPEALNRLQMDKNYVRERKIVCVRTCYASDLVMEQLQSRMQGIANKIQAYITQRYPAYKFEIQSDFSSERMILHVKCTESPIEVYTNDKLIIDNAVQRVFGDIREYVRDDYHRLEGIYEKMKPDMEDEPKPIDFILNIYCTPDTKILPLTQKKAVYICGECGDPDDLEVYPAHNLSGNWLWVNNLKTGSGCLLTPDGVKRASYNFDEMECVIDGCDYKVNTYKYTNRMFQNLNYIHMTIFAENKIIEQQKDTY
jgi:hypothetical protein